MTRYIIKINAPQAPNGIGIPGSELAWEGGVLITKPPRRTLDKKRLPPEQTKAPGPGDRLLIWINDGDGGSNREEGGGSGLTASANVIDCVRNGKKLEIRVGQVKLFSNPRLDRHDLANENRDSGTSVDDLKQARGSELRFIDEVRWNNLERRAATKINVTESYEIARLRRLLSQATRPKQREFSRKIRQLYGNKCAVTGCSTHEALEAAHIRLVEGKERADDNSRANGILLRSDIHALFDAHLITLSEDGKSLIVSSELEDPTYASLAKASVSLPTQDAPARKNIRDHRSHFYTKVKNS